MHWSSRMIDPIEAAIRAALVAGHGPAVAWYLLRAIAAIAQQVGASYLEVEAALARAWGEVARRDQRPVGDA
jgi:hypothetical protein